ncbi:hypothetical protein A2U01_0083660, partial [Trifolium medium]|nr:hypothetical protein [Trifolium medium]
DGWLSGDSAYPEDVFHVFGLQRSCPKGETAKGKTPKGVEAGKHGWVSLKQRKGLFKTFEESVRGFKE